MSLLYIPGDKKCLVSQEKTINSSGFFFSDTVNSSANFNTLLQTPTVTVTAINRLWPYCALLQNTQTPPSSI